MLTSDQLNQPLLEHLNTGVVLLNADLTVSYMNSAAEALLAVSGKRGIGMPFYELAYESDAASQALMKAQQDGKAFTKRETHIRLHNHHEITLDYSVSPLIHPDTQQQALLIELHGRDRLMRINREEQLIAKQQTTRNLVRGLAHEVKNPLGGIRGAAQLLERELPSDSLKEYTDIIIEEADRLRSLVDRLLGPRQLPQNEPMNIHELMERVCQLIQVESDGKLTIKRDYDPSIPEFKADKSHLIQCLLNISRNAMQAMLETTTEERPTPAHPTLSLRTRTVNQFTIGHHRHRLVLRIDIKDNGPGIPPELHDQLFYPMVSGRAEGSGLGLSISQSLINQAGGIIEYNSQPGCTVFSIFLPLQSCE